jgi:hypothetical protein
VNGECGSTRVAWRLKTQRRDGPNAMEVHEGWSEIDGSGKISGHCWRLDNRARVS